MKAIQSIRQTLPAIIFTAALMALSFDGSAQNNRKSNKSDRNKDRREYRNDHYNSSDNWEGRNDDRQGDRKHYKEYSHGRNDGDYQYSEHYSNRPAYGRQSYYNHPQYGRVYQRFDDQPIVFRHSHGDYYYHGNQFYTFRDGVGYCPTEYPRNVYFRDLPFDCNRVQVNGQVFFRHGDFYFSHSQRGYIMVPSPLEVNFSLRF